MWWITVIAEDCLGEVSAQRASRIFLPIINPAGGEGIAIGDDVEDSSYIERFAIVAEIVNLDRLAVRLLGPLSQEPVYDH